MKLNNIFIFMLCSISVQQSLAAEFFVRPDGGTWEQCNGSKNVAYSENVENKACAVKHIFELISPENHDSPNTYRISGGDIITIMNNPDGSQAEYEMGRHDNYTSGNCHESWNYDCYMPSIPAGNALNPTIIRGESWAQGCTNPPQLWGSGRAKHILRLVNTSNVELSCLEITDHSSCITASQYPNKDLVCDRSAPFNKPFADVGIYMADATDITLTDIEIKGLSTGIHAGRLGNVSLIRSHLHANTGAGWDGDLINGPDDVTGTILFDESSITFSGCGLIYNPGKSDHFTPHACARQDIGGYGDGLGSGNVGGNWIFKNSKILYNSSDGIDLLYHINGGKITIENSRFEGNAGNPIKVTGNTEIVNNIIISNCAWNERQVYSLGGEGEICRAGAVPLVLSWAGTNDKSVVLNNTVVSEGDCLVHANDRTGVGVQSQSLYMVNNIFYGVTDYRQTWENSCMYYHDPDIDFPYRQIHNNIIHQVKNYLHPCDNLVSNIPDEETANEGLCTKRDSGSFYDDSDYTVPTNPHFENLNLGIVHTAYDLKTLELEGNNVSLKDRESPAYNTGYNGTVGGVEVPNTDYFGNPRDELPEIGAVEYVVRPKAPNIINIQQVN